MRYWKHPVVWIRRVGAIFAALMLAGLSASTNAHTAGASFRDGKAAYLREDYAAAQRILIPLAQRGDPAAQTYLGFMFETGRGVPQNYTEAAYWYRRAAEQGNSTAQYTLGLLYDKGFGVREDPVEASKWLNLSTANASRISRDVHARLRDAVNTKLTRGQFAEARRRALEWYPQPEPRNLVSRGVGEAEAAPLLRLR